MIIYYNVFLFNWPGFPQLPHVRSAPPKNEPLGFLEQIFTGQMLLLLPVIIKALQNLTATNRKFYRITQYDMYSKSVLKSCGSLYG